MTDAERAAFRAGAEAMKKAAAEACGVRIASIRAANLYRNSVTQMGQHSVHIVELVARDIAALPIHEPEASDV